MVHKEHWYNGVKLVSATELKGILKITRFDPKRKRIMDGLEIWRRDLCECRSCKPEGDGVCGFVKGDVKGQEAADISNIVHDEVATFINTGYLPDGCGIWSRKIADELKLTNTRKLLVNAEEILKDNQSNLSGSADSIVISDDGESIDDVKIKSRLDIYTPYQGHTYRYLVRRLFNKDISKMRVWWGKTKTVGKLVEKVTYNLDDTNEEWIGLVKIWNRANPKRQVKLLG